MKCKNCNEIIKQVDRFIPNGIDKDKIWLHETIKGYGFFGGSFKKKSNMGCMEPVPIK